MARPPLIGREQDLSRLVAEFDACRVGRKGRTVVVHGAAGVGSSSIVHEPVDPAWRRSIEIDRGPEHGVAPGEQIADAERYGNVRSDPLADVAGAVEAQ